MGLPSPRSECWQAAIFREYSLTGCKILTGALPYVTKDRDTAIIVAISQQVAPADLSSDSHDMPGYVRSILTACWKQEREKRPTMIWCRAALRAKTVDPFENIYSSGFLKLDGDIVRGYCYPLAQSLIVYIGLDAHLFGVPLRLKLKRGGIFERNV